MTAQQHLRTAILQYLHEQETDESASLSELCEQLHAPLENVVDALDWLEEQGFVKAKHLDRYTRLCQITYSGRQLVKESARQEISRQDGRSPSIKPFDKLRTTLRTGDTDDADLH